MAQGPQSSQNGSDSHCSGITSFKKCYMEKAKVTQIGSRVHVCMHP